MFARSTTLHGRSENLDAGIRYIEDEVAPMMETIEGCRGLSLLVDRETGHCIATSSWESEEDMRASEERLRPARERGRDILGGTMQVDEWEIALMHRADHGQYCRVSWIQGDPDRLVDVFRTAALPAVEQIDGFCSASCMVNRANRMCCVTTTYATREQLESSRDIADQIRMRAMAAAEADVLDVREFELAYAHLHVPELV